MRLALLVSPLAKGAYFAETLEVARAELEVLVDGVEPRHARVGGLDFFEVEVDDAKLVTLARASFVHGIFAKEAGSLRPLAVEADFDLPEALVFGAKYPGKTHELVTQLAINLAIHHGQGRKPKALLDPMAGQGTTLLWALRYGLSARGIEREAGALEALHRHVKKQTKLHRLKHRHDEGFVGRRNREGRGKFVRYELAGRSLQLITGDSREAPELLAGQRFDLVVTDLPYGVRFKGDRRRNPLETVRECAPGWVASLREGGAMVLIFNRYQPEREALAEVFTAQGCRLESFAAPHRMGESILRDLIVLTRPLTRGR